MQASIIKKMHEELIETKHCTVPGHLLPRAPGYNLLAWAQELILYYDQEGVVVHPFDDLPPLKLSADAAIETTVQDLHRFIISDVSLVPLETRKVLVALAARSNSSAVAWQQMLPLLLRQLRHLDQESVVEELSWKFSPVAELLWAATWFFMEREAVRPPASLRLVASRFPYYLWLTAENRQSFWEPENPLCRWEWLALDLYGEWLKQSAACGVLSTVFYTA